MAYRERQRLNLVLGPVIRCVHVADGISETERKNDVQFLLGNHGKK